MSDLQKDKDAKQRLLDAAEKLFCEKGYESTSVRDLTTEADCNVAAVNYHFGGKDQLYIQMFRRHMQDIVTQMMTNVADVMNSDDVSLEKLIRSIATFSLSSLATDAGEKPLLKLLVREMLNPHAGESFLMADIFQDYIELLVVSLTRLVPKMDRRKAMLCIYSIDGLNLHAILFSDFYFQGDPQLNLDGLIEYFVRFICAGIRSIAEDDKI